MLPGDLILAIDGVDVRPLSVEDIAGRLRGPVSSQVRLVMALRGAARGAERDVRRAPSLPKWRLECRALSVDGA